MESLNKKTSILQNIKKKFITLMIPFYFFSLISLLTFSIHNNLSLNDLQPHILILLKGNVRNASIIGSLWFLTCLFITHIIFEFVKKLKNKLLIIGVCLTLYIISEKLLPFRPIVTPKWYYNVDSSFYYIIFFCIGYAVFPKINKLLLSKNILNKLIVYSTGGISFLYTILYFYNIVFFSKFVTVPFLSVFIPIFQALIIIYFYIVLSYICRNILIFSAIGKNVLFLCGNEFIVKIIVPIIVNMVGLQVSLTTPAFTFIYTALLLYLANTFIVPAEREIIAVINKVLL